MIAITREISPAILTCELTHLPRTPIDLARATAQHRQYEARLAGAGCTIERLATTPTLADSVFVEDIAVVLDECAILTRPGAVSRRAETAAVADALARHRPLSVLEPPATLDGGDVLVVGRRVFVGLSARTNRDGLGQVRRILEPHGYDVQGIRVEGCLHLKSAVTAISGDTLLVNRRWIPVEALGGFDLIDVDPAEPHAANALRLGDAVIYPTGFPRTQARIADLGVRVRTVDVGELAKAEGAVTCCSLIISP